MTFDFDDFSGLLRDGRSRDEILTAMKEHGLTISQAIKVSMHLFGFGLGDAKSIVSSHPSWIETAQAANPLQDALIEIFRATEDPEK
jgi:hypothetical protein